MDFMKVFDQTVREIKREVNLKVLKVPEIEQKVLDATDDEPWGPHGTVLAEIAQATKKLTECQMIMNVLWTRLEETGKNWRLVYKALTVIEYLVGHGSEHSVDDIIEHTFQISSLTSFEYVEPNGKDVGINVRKKAENIVALLNDKDKIQDVRNKASANRDKYVGLSSSGISYKSSTSSFGSNSFASSDKYSNWDSKEKDDYENYKKSKQSAVNGSQETKKNSSRLGSSTISQTSNSVINKDEEFDDFDPRGTSTKPAAIPSNKVDLFESDLLGDIMEQPENTATNHPYTGNDSSEVDLFADSAFVSAPKVETISQSQNPLDLFGDVPATSSAQPTIDLFSSNFTQQEAITTKPEPTKSAPFDPFEAVPVNNFTEPDIFGDFSSNTNLSSMEAGKAPLNDSTKKETFQVKSGIWADSLTRGLIDLNISAPKKVSLIDVGVVGDLDGNPDKEKGPATSYFPTRAMGVGSGLGKATTFTASPPPAAQPGDDDFFSSLTNQQYQFGSFQK